MNEIQGPTPAGTSRPYRNLREALRAHRIAEENHEFITAIVDAVGATAFIDRGRYIEAIRREGAALHIGKTYTNGFAESEQVSIGSTPLRLQPSEGRAPYFYVRTRVSSVRSRQPAAPPSAQQVPRRRPLEWNRRCAPRSRSSATTASAMSAS